MKNVLLAAGAMALLASLRATAFDVSYTGDQLVSSPWFVSNPAYTTAPGTATFGNGTANPFLEQVGGPSSPWNPSGLTGEVELQFTMDTESLSGYTTGVDIQNSLNAWGVLINDGVITVIGTTGTTALIPALTLNQEHTVDLSYTAGLLDISLDGTPIAALQGLAGAVTTANAIDVNRYTGSIGNDAVTTFESVSWDNGQVIPEPSISALLALAGVAGLGFVLKRRAVRA